MRPFLCLAFTAFASAHPLQITGVTVRLDRASTEVTVVAHLPMLAADAAQELPRRLKLNLDGETFHPAHVLLDRDASQDTVIWTAREDRPARAVSIGAPIFPDHLEDTTLVLVYRDGALVDRAALTPSQPSAILGEGTLTVFRRFVKLGIDHILAGPDHLLFLIGLILVGGPARRLLAVITAFTLAHSLTLSLTVLGLASLPSRFIEPMIALSIVVVGLENLLRREAGFAVRVWLSFGFGFFHGFGFAGALADAGLPRQALGWSLAAFNIGVEIGQAAILLVVLPLLLWLHRTNERASRMVTQYVSLVITLAGAVWFLARIWVT